MLTRRKAGSEVDTAAGVDRRLLFPTRLPVPVVHQLAVEHGTAGRGAQVCRRVAAAAAGVAQGGVLGGPPVRAAPVEAAVAGAAAQRRVQGAANISNLLDFFGGEGGRGQENIA